MLLSTTMKFPMVMCAKMSPARTGRRRRKDRLTLEARNVLNGIPLQGGSSISMSVGPLDKASSRAQ